MSDALFDGVHEISDEMVIEKMRYFIEKAKELKDLYKTNKRECLELAIKLRKELEVEYKNNNLLRIGKIYRDHKLFSAFYSPAIQDAFVKTSGRLSYEKLYGFLYDIEDYMNYHMPKEYKSRVQSNGKE